jgi:prepilin signal peptidase PulO-like enzyme (type II secretory pathway)
MLTNDFSETVVALVLLGFLSFFSWTDIRYRRIPNSIIGLGMMVALILRWLVSDELLPEYLLGGFLGWSVLMTLAFISRGGIGGGDVKLYAMIGIFVGWKLVIMILLIATIIGLLYGITVMMLKGKKSNYAIPFAPFTLVSALLVYGWGEELVRGYFSWIKVIISPLTS